MIKVKKLLSISFLVVCMILSFGIITACDKSESGISLSLDNYNEYLGITYNNPIYTNSSADGSLMFYTVAVYVSPKNENYEFKNCKIKFTSGEYELSSSGRASFRQVASRVHIGSGYSDLIVNTKPSAISGRVIVKE